MTRLGLLIMSVVSMGILATHLAFAQPAPTPTPNPEDPNVQHKDAAKTEASVVATGIECDVCQKDASTAKLGDNTVPSNKPTLMDGDAKSGTK